MKLTQGHDIIVPQPYLWYPLTANSTDIIRGRTSTPSNIQSYDDRGAYFNGASYINLGAQLNSLQKTIYLEINADVYVSTDVETVYKAQYGTGSSSSTTMYLFMPCPAWAPNSYANFGTIISGNFTTWNISDVIEDGTYYKICIRQNTDGTTSCYCSYQNGTYSGTYSQSIADSISLYTYLGTNGGGYNRYFKGYMRNLKMWDLQLSDEQINSLMQ